MSGGEWTIVIFGAYITAVFLITLILSAYRHKKEEERIEVVEEIIKAIADVVYDEKEKEEYDERYCKHDHGRN